MSANKLIKLPDYNIIIDKCIVEMEIKFNNYGNDWLKLDDEYWKKRMMNEVKEYIDSMTIDSEKRKLLNIINIACMAIDTIDNRATKAVAIHCLVCNKLLLEHISVNGYFVCDANI